MLSLSYLLLPHYTLNVDPNSCLKVAIRTPRRIWEIGLHARVMPIPSKSPGFQFGHHDLKSTKFLAVYKSGTL